jgi:DNA-binding GntR family transcriptional regulator
VTAKQNSRSELALQESAMKNDDLPSFHALDYNFHTLKYVLGNNPLAFEVILDCEHKSWIAFAC